VTASATLPQKHCTSTDASLASSAAMALAVRGLMRFAKAGREVYKPRLDCKSSDVQILLNATIYVHYTVATDQRIMVHATPFLQRTSNES